MSSREGILTRIKAAKPLSIPLPEVERFETHYDDPVQKFKDVLASIGGKVIMVDEFDDLKAALDTQFENYSSRATNVASLSEWADFSLQVSDPHALETINVAVIEAEIGVAENAAIWVGENHLSHRVLPFITQYLAIVLPKSGIVNNMHDAFEKLGPITDGWGAFIAGPSKTADIEQSLVIGAHGARGLTVFLT